MNLLTITKMVGKWLGIKASVLKQRAKSNLHHSTMHIHSRRLFQSSSMTVQGLYTGISSITERGVQSLQA